jgi:hypothetical protein
VAQHESRERRMKTTDAERAAEYGDAGSRVAGWSLVLGSGIVAVLALTTTVTLAVSPSARVFMVCAMDARVNMGECLSFVRRR